MTRITAAYRRAVYVYAAASRALPCMAGSDSTAFAEQVLIHAGRLWMEATGEQRVQLGTVLFPEGVTFDGWEMQTPLSAFQGDDLQKLSRGNSGLVDQRGRVLITGIAAFAELAARLRAWDHLRKTAGFPLPLASPP